jgi:hypothetical protein
MVTLEALVTERLQKIVNRISEVPGGMQPG